MMKREHFTSNMNNLITNKHNERNILSNISQRDASNHSVTFQQRLQRLKMEGFVYNVHIQAKYSFDYNSYPRFSALCAYPNETVKPKLKPITWTTKLIEDLYDSRFQLEKSYIEKDKNDVDHSNYYEHLDIMLAIFPVFVVNKLGTNVGLRSLSDQLCWDLMYNITYYRKDNIEIEIFSRFLQVNIIRCIKSIHTC